MVVELSVQYCGQILYDSFETYKTILRRIIMQFDREIDFQNHLFEWIHFENCYFYITTSKNVTENLQ